MNLWHNIESNLGHREGKAPPADIEFQCCTRYRTIKTYLLTAVAARKWTKAVVCNEENQFSVVIFIDWVKMCEYICCCCSNEEKPKRNDPRVSPEQLIENTPSNNNNNGSGNVRICASLPRPQITILKIKKFLAPYSRWAVGKVMKYYQLIAHVQMLHL